MTVKAPVQTMHVPHFTGNGRIDFTDKAVPEPGSGQLLIRVKANALCGSERPQFYEGSEVTPGHEAAGIVAAAGPGTHTAIGTPGVIFLMDFCGECRSCKLGLTNQCLQKRADMGFNKDGGYGTYELINENIFFPVDPGLDLADATMLLDVMGTNGHGIRRASLVHPDIQSMLVSGAGPIGLGMLAMAKITFGQDFPVLITDILPRRLQFAEQLGGKPINFQDGALKDGMARHGIASVDVVMDTTGKGAARQAGLSVLAQRGIMVCIGHGEGLSLTVSPDLIATERAVMGSEYFCYSELAGNLDLMEDNVDYLRPS